MDAGGELFGVVAGGPDLLAFFPDDGCGAGVLAEREDAVGGDFRVFEEHEGDHAVIFRGLRIAENRGDLGEVRGAKGEIDGLDGFCCEEGESFRGDFEDALSFEDRGGYVIAADPLVFSGIGAEWEGVLVEEWLVRHGVPEF